MCRLTGIIFCAGLLMVSAAGYAAQDPMRPPHFSNPTESRNTKKEPIVLQQILISKDRKIVIVNDKVLQEGQSISGAKIIKIEANQIRIRRAGVNGVIKLLPFTKEIYREI